MKKEFLVSIFCILSFNLFGQTQTEMNTKAKMEYEKVDKELNLVYQKLLQAYKNDTIFIRSMKDAQRQWLKFRDAQVKMKYPSYIDSDGTVLPMCKSYYLMELTTSRIKELKKWLDGVEEGDSCSGSIRIKQ